MDSLSQPLYDPAAMQQLTADTDAEFRAIALARFQLDLADFIARLEKVEPRERLRLIHTMSSSAALMGAMQLAVHCLDLEVVALRMAPAQIRQIVEIARQTAEIYATL